MRIGIVGAGVAGLSCAQSLATAGHDVAVFDKGRGAGGRMATRRIETPEGPIAFDHGAQYFTARDPAFRRQVADWWANGVVARWPDDWGDAWVGVPGMNAVVKAMADGIDIAWCERIESVRRADTGWFLEPIGAGPFDAVIVATPAEQAAPLLEPHDAGMADIARGCVSAPCWTAMLAFQARVGIEVDVVRNLGIIAWAARNSAKPGRTGQEAWVVQATAEWSAAYLEATADFVAEALAAALSELADRPLPQRVVSAAHRWRFARAGSIGAGGLWNSVIGLGAAGDWLSSPRVEGPWLSGRRLAEMILATDAAAVSARRQQRR